MNMRAIKNWMKAHEPHGAVKFCAGVEISVQTLMSWARGTSKPRIETAARVAEFLGISIEELLEQPKQETPPAA